MSLNSNNGFGASKPMPQDDYEISNRLIFHVQTIEGFNPVAVKDVLSKPQRWMIGFGFTFGVIEGQTISYESATDRLKRELQFTGGQVCHFVRVPLTLGQWEALIDFAYNVGITAFSYSTLNSKIQAGDMLGAANEFTRWNRAGGVVYPGLIKRRSIERQWFIDGCVPSAAPVSEAVSNA